MDRRRYKSNLSTLYLHFYVYLHLGKRLITAHLNRFHNVRGLADSLSACGLGVVGLKPETLFLFGQNSPTYYQLSYTTLTLHVSNSNRKTQKKV